MMLLRVATFVALVAVCLAARGRPLKPDPRVSLNVPPVPLFHDGRGCLSNNKTTSCSNHGQCIRDPAKFFGVARVVTRRGGFCKCDDGWLGPGCAVPLSAVGRRQRIRMLAAGYLHYNPLSDKWTQTEKGARVPRYVFLATHYGPTGSNSTHYDGRAERSSAPYRGALHSWVQPRAESNAAGGRLLVEWQRQSGEVGVDGPKDYHKEVIDNTPTPSPTYDPAEERIAQFTNWKGRSILAPPINVQQATYQGNVNVPKKKKTGDVTIPKLLNALNIAQGEGRSQFGAPPAVPAAVAGVKRPKVKNMTKSKPQKRKRARAAPTVAKNAPKSANSTKSTRKKL